MHLLLKQFSKALNNPAEAEKRANSKARWSSIKLNKRPTQLVTKIFFHCLSRSTCEACYIDESNYFLTFLIGIKTYNLCIYLGILVCLIPVFNLLKAKMLYPNILEI